MCSVIRYGSGRLHGHSRYLSGPRLPSRRLAALLPRGTSTFALTSPPPPSSTQQRISQFQFPLNQSRSLVSTTVLRTMASSTSTPAKHEFLCILPDKPGARAKRIEVRPSHLEGVKPLVANGTVVVGGATLESHPQEGETPAFTGSMLIAVAENAEVVREMISKDIYATSGVWDLEKMQIIPFKSAVRLGM